MNASSMRDLICCLPAGLSSRLKAAKGQQLDDHYFASIPERVEEFMKDFELESLKLGIPILTRHNEVAPGQYECAPMFEESNLAVDHNQLIRVIMERTAVRHKFRASVQ